MSVVRFRPWAIILASSSGDEDSDQTVPMTEDSKTIVKKIMDAKTAPQKLLIVCPDRIRRERFVANIFKKFVPDFSKKSIQADSLTVMNAGEFNSSNLSSLSDDLNSYSLFSKERFFLINGLDNLPSALNKSFLNITSKDYPSLYLVMTAAKFAANSQIYNFYKKTALVVDLPQLKNLELVRWTERELKSQGIKSWDEGLPEALLQCAEGSPDKISELVEKLSLFLEEPSAHMQDLREISQHSADPSEFQLLDNLKHKKLFWKSELLIEKIFQSDKNAFALLGLIARTYNNYLSMAYMKDQGAGLQEIRQKLGLPPWLFNKQVEASKAYELKRLCSSMKSVLKADSKLKNRSLGEKAIFSELIEGL